MKEDGILRIEKYWKNEITENELLKTAEEIRKNQWLKELSELLKANHFLGAVYFNVDYTNGLILPSV